MGFEIIKGPRDGINLCALAPAGISRQMHAVRGNTGAHLNPLTGRKAAAAGAECRGSAKQPTATSTQKKLALLRLILGVQKKWFASFFLKINLMSATWQKKKTTNTSLYF